MNSVPLHPTVAPASAPIIQECAVNAHGAYLAWHSTHPSSVMNSSEQAAMQDREGRQQKK